MKDNQRFLAAGMALLLAVTLLCGLFVASPRLTKEANMRYASGAQEMEDPDMAELLTLLNGE